MATVTFSSSLARKEYIRVEDFQRSSVAASDDLKPSSTTLIRKQPSKSRDGRLELSSELSGLLVDAEVWEHWHDSKLDAEVQHIEGILYNHGKAPVKQLTIQIEPAEAVMSCWNVVEVGAGRFRLAPFWTDDEWMGGIASGVTLYFGCLIKGEGASISVLRDAAET